MVGQDLVLRRPRRPATASSQKCRRNLYTLFTTALLSLLLTSCTVGPNYSKPSIPVAPAYTEQPPAKFQEGWKAAQPKDQTIKGNWWEIFGDAQLNQLEEKVAPGNFSLKSAQTRFDQARTLIRVNRSNLYPTVSTGPAISSNHVSANVPVGAAGRNYGLFDFPISATWDADFFGRIKRSVTAAREQAQASAADLENMRLELQTELAVDYFEARALDAQKQILDDNVTGYEKALQLTQNRYQGGVASKAEVAQAQTQLNQTQAEDIDVGVARAQFEHAIAVLMGQAPEGFHLPPNPLHDEPPVIPVGVPSQLLERRPDIASAERQMAAANEQIGIAKAAFFPDLVISATGGLQAGSIVDWFTWPSRYWAVGPQMLQTIFDAGRRRAQLDFAQLGYEATVSDYRQFSLTAFQEVEDNLSTLRILETEQAKQHEAVTAAQNSEQLSLNRYKGGLVTYLEVITAQTIALTNERTEMDLLRRRMDASVQLIRALGGGWDTGKLPKV
jgi:NodT family efflux transporter outer membrane factor (OMF) lipoprotein